MTIEQRIAELRSRVAAESRSLAIPLELREGDPATTTGGFTLKGHAAVFDRKSEDLGGFREVIKRGAFRKSLDESQDVVALWDHDTRLVLARTSSGTLELREDPKGLSVYADVADTSYARDLRALLERRDVSQMSFGFTVGEDRWTIKTRDGEEEVLREIVSVERLFDVSVVAIPAYPQTDAVARDHSLDAEITLITSTVRSLKTTGRLDVGLVMEELARQGAADDTEQRDDDAGDTALAVEPVSGLALRRARLRRLAI